MTGEAPRAADMFQLDRATCLALLTVQHVGRLVIPGQKPRIMTLNYVLVNDTIVFRAEVGSASEQIVGRAVAFEVDMVDERTRSGWSVVARGVGAIATTRDGAAVVGDRRIRVDSWAPGAKDRWLTITVGEVTGRLLRGEVAPTWVNEQSYL